MNSPLLERYLSPKQVETMFNLPVTSLEKALIENGATVYEVWQTY